MRPIERTKKPNNCVKPLFLKNPGLVYSKPIMILLLILLPYSITFFIGNPYIIPLSTSVPASIILFRHLRNSKPQIAILDMLLYVFWLTVIGIFIMYFRFDRAGWAIIHGEEYIAEMSPWLRGDVAKESNPALFIPEHLNHMAIVAVSSLISCGFLALLFGTILMNYMNYYVVWLMRMSTKPFLLAIIGWHPWSVLRVISFIILGCALAMPLTSKIGKKQKLDYRKLFWMIGIAITLEAVDIILKATIGSSWRSLIVNNLSPSFKIYPFDFGR